MLGVLEGKLVVVAAVVAVELLVEYGLLEDSLEEQVVVGAV